VGEGGEYSGWGPLVSSHRIGVALWKMGEYEMAKSYFNLQIELCNESIKLGRSFVTSRAAYYDLAGAYAWLGEKEKAIHFLKEYNKRQFIPLWWVIQTKVDPLFEPIRNEPEYQQIVREVEAKYQAEHERVRKWLEENDKL
jgi:tetratricopeptide (TPR) repeat protein